MEHAGLSPAWPALTRARQGQINICVNQITEGFFGRSFLSGFARGSYIGRLETGVNARKSVTRLRSRAIIFRMGERRLRPLKTWIIWRKS
jgi:hypothetical protein